MCRTQCVLALLALSMGMAHSFSWDIAVAYKHLLEFYSNGALEHYEDFPSRNIFEIIYDSLHNRILMFEDRNNSTYIHSYDLSTKTLELITILRTPTYVVTMANPAYDPVTELLFWSNMSEIISIHLVPSCEPPIKTIVTYEIPFKITVDSCEGFIYYSDPKKIAKVRFDGSDREVIVNIVDNTEIFALNMDPQTQKIYWTVWNHTYYNSEFYVQSADLNGKNVKEIYKEEGEFYGIFLSVSRDYIFWGHPGTLFQYPKNSPHNNNPKRILNKFLRTITSHYTVEDQILGTANCTALKNLISLRDSQNASLLCVHGTKVSGKSVCECTQGYTGDSCEVSVCHNYCFRGDCNVSAEGQPQCRCNVGYSGERCEVNICQGYCLNNGVCCLNSQQPICQCTGDYEGDRCEASVSSAKFFQTVSMLKDLLNTDVTSLTLD